MYRKFPFVIFLFFTVAVFVPIFAVPTRWVSWWYACDNNWPAAVKIIQAANLSTVTSVQTYCGWTVADNGTVVGSTSSQCKSFFEAITALGVQAELTLDSGNCSIDAYRTLWKDTIDSPQLLLQAAQAVNATGWNIDLEPQGDNCQSGGTGTPADAVLFASWLTATKKVLNTAGIRLTVDVASWSPVLSQYGVLASSVDRLQCMETYNGDSLDQWLTYYNDFLNAIPIDKAGVGIGTWLDGKTDWWETPVGAQTKINYAIQDHVPELACFRIDPETSPTWPPTFWWNILNNYTNSP